MKKRVVITGIGAITPVGLEVEKFWENVKNGNHGIKKISIIDTDNLAVHVGADIPEFNPKDFMDRKEAKRMDRFTQFAVAAAKEAFKDSGLNAENYDPWDMGVILGSGIGGLETIETEKHKLDNRGAEKVSPFFIPMTILNMAAGRVSIMLNAKNICNSVVTACASGTNAIGEAFRNIKDGYSEIIITGGAEASITPLALSGFSNMGALSKSEDIDRASIPFDVERSGFVMGEGSGILVLESLEHAKKRNAKIYAEIVGYGVSCDANHITAPLESGEGAERAMTLALKEAMLEPSNIDYINAHGTSTPHNDSIETKAIIGAFKEHSNKLKVSSTKSVTGHLLGAAGGIEGIICALALKEGIIPPTVGLKEEDPKCTLDYVKGKSIKKDIKYALSNSLGFGGHNASIILKKWEE
jgi:3-oxoacyl-[acyl-carrier-protein] synthase II